MTIKLGAHARSDQPLDEARALGFEVVQCNLSDPQSWKKPSFAHDLSDAAIEVYVHAPYVINVASPNNRIRIPSRKLLQQHITEAARIGAVGVVVHGGHVTKDDDPAEGVANWRKAIDGLDLPIPLFIENTAGGQFAMARYLDTLARLWDGIADSANIAQIGLCLDTCHAFAAGLSMDTLVDDVRAITGRIDLVHLNDSAGEAGSGRDRHASLGAGKIPEAALVQVVQAADTAVVLETPVEGHAADLEWLRSRL